MRSLSDLNKFLNISKYTYHNSYDILVYGGFSVLKKNYNSFISLFVRFINKFLDEKIGNSKLPFFIDYKIKEGDYELKNKIGQGLEFYFHSESGNPHDGYMCHLCVETVKLKNIKISIPESAEAGVESGICSVILKSSFIIYIKTDLNLMTRFYMYVRFKILMRIFGYKIKIMK